MCRSIYMFLTAAFKTKNKSIDFNGVCFTFCQQMTSHLGAGTGRLKTSMQLPSTESISHHLQTSKLLSVSPKLRTSHSFQVFKPEDPEYLPQYHEMQPYRRSSHSRQQPNERLHHLLDSRCPAAPTPCAIAAIIDEFPSLNSSTPCKTLTDPLQPAAVDPARGEGHAFVCSVCPYGTNNIKNYRSHTRTHSASSDQSYHCPQCPYVSTQASNLRTHIKKHTGEKPFTCSICTKEFRQHVHLHRHLHTHKIEGMDISCPQCNTIIT